MLVSRKKCTVNMFQIKIYIDLNLIITLLMPIANKLINSHYLPLRVSVYIVLKTLTVMAKVKK